ncbi:hypothetical protein MPSEU_001002300 [Mayamaea pseudoterrestris]|nr:hypothetical protein MPSEU_001002300 [Mayamaea pseudoterrestris]
MNTSLTFRSFHKRFGVRLTSSLSSSPASLGGGSIDQQGVVAANTHRLSKLIAEHAHMSRREAERLIKNGEVTLAGKIVTSPQILVANGSVQNSALQVLGKVVNVNDGNTTKTNLSMKQQEQDKPTTRVWLAHKLAGEIVSDSDPLGRPSLMQRMARGGVGKIGKHTKLHLKPVGRLDLPTEGLILLTNDGNYARQLELPSSLVHRVYRVRAHGNVTDYKLAQIAKGLTIDGVRYAPMKVRMDSASGGRRSQAASNKWLQVTCAEGKNRQIRKVFSQMGLDVTRLIRIAYGDYQLQTIPPGMAVEVNVKPVKTQKNRGFLFPKRRPAKVAEKESQETDANKSTVRWVRHL